MSGEERRIEEEPGEEGWTRARWRRFLLAFGALFLAANAVFWYHLARVESTARLYEERLRRFDQEWAYLQRLALLQRIEQGLLTEEEEPRAVFRGRHAGISFAYPAVWGELVESEAAAHYVSVRFRRGEASRLLGAFAGVPDPMLITGWDSIAANVRTPEDVRNACATQTLADTCLTITNSSGLRYARIRYREFREVRETLNDVVLYVFANPGGDFPGIALGNVELRRLGVPHSIADMDALMDSVILER